MWRQRLRLTRSPLAFLGRASLLILALGLVWYGAMTMLLAVKVDPGAVESISGYRAAFDFLAGLTPVDIDDQVRLIVGLTGLAAFLASGYLALKELPRPHLTRSSVGIVSGELGSTDVSPRALERVAEIAAAEHPAVSATAGRLNDDTMSVNLRVDRARDVPAALRGAQERIRAALELHGVPVNAVDVTVTGFDRSTRRELS